MWESLKIWKKWQFTNDNFCFVRKRIDQYYIRMNPYFVITSMNLPYSVVYSIRKRNKIINIHFFIDLIVLGCSYFHKWVMSSHGSFADARWAWPCCRMLIYSRSLYIWIFDIHCNRCAISREAWIVNETNLERINLWIG